MGRIFAKSAFSLKGKADLAIPRRNYPWKMARRTFTPRGAQFLRPSRDSISRLHMALFFSMTSFAFAQFEPKSSRSKSPTTGSSIGGHQFPGSRRSGRLKGRDEIV